MDPRNLSGLKVLVIGLGRTGVATAHFLASRDARVYISEEKKREDVEDSQRLIEGTGATVQTGGHDTGILSGIDLIIPSPGVPPRNVLLAEGIMRGIPVVSELELASWFISTPIVAITGTNGKTTTTALIGALLARGGRRVYVGGNIGTPLVAVVDEEEKYDCMVVEVSSFQLMWCERFSPAIGILLNTTIDHMDYHASFAEYRSIKERIFANQTTSCCAVLNADDPRSAPLAKRISAAPVFFSSSQVLAEGIFVNGTSLRYRDAAGRNENYPLEAVRLRGNHNRENIMASIVAARWCGCEPSAIAESLRTFPGLSHRIEYLGATHGVEFYDDSKGTNADAVARALESFSKPVILLMGGRDKTGGFDVLAPLIRTKVKELILFGEARETIRAYVGSVVPTVSEERLAGAVRRAVLSASPGDVVLLSPGCASFDEFRNYEERGNHFRETVNRMTGGLTRADD
ncbi:MAG: UDP-N-acetylmuramoyl-L-alanine--D-glutamate ligase [Deltaproteobacteria bacterium]|nr:UDP-N-acetylmuramoyl-L-alanine--D-glutamate ligase [Deltaproteobacteria bacterium]